MTSFIRIDNIIVEKIGQSGISSMPISLYEKRNKVKLVLQNVPYVNTGSRRTDSLLIQSIHSGKVPFDSLNITYPIDYYNFT